MNNFIIPKFPFNDIPLFSESDIEVIKGYTRIVVGKRGAYVEFKESHLDFATVYIPNTKKWKLTSPKAFYHEYRTRRDKIKIYFQQKTVAYADYKKGRYYISVHDLFTKDLKSLIRPNNSIINKL